MTENEHKLIIYMLTLQNIRIKALWELLASRGIVEENDFDAFQHLAKEQMGDEMMLATMSQYQEYARLLSLQVTLPRAGLI